MLIPCLVGAVLSLATTSCDKAHGDPADAAVSATLSTPADEVQPRAPLTNEEKQFYRDLGRQAWSYMVTNYEPTSGLVKATPDWANTTLWDVGGQLLATHAAKELGLITQAELDKRVTTALGTIEKMELFRGLAYNKLYVSKDGSISKEGRLGWSATDLGRFLLTMKILSLREPQYAQRIERIVRRNNFKEVVKSGYLYGQMIGSTGKPWSFQEGRIGYEQYSAEGFRQWGIDVGNALNVKRNARTIKLMGVEIFEDRRRLDRLLSEPFILYGLEVGMSGDYLKLANNVLRLQEARFKNTGKMTIATEDAVSVPPQFFYYYCVYCNGKPFIIDIAQPGKELDSPRWVSTKGAFGWNAVLPDEYTKRAIDFVAAAKDAKRGWASGVFEESGKSTLTYDINTAAVLLEIALFQLRGAKPLIQAAAIQ